MIILTPPAIKGYQLIDSGNGMRLEQFGSHVIIRPDASCIWKPALADRIWNKASWTCTKNAQGSGFTWTPLGNASTSWEMPCALNDRQADMSLLLRVGQSKNIGVFPEQIAHWDWMTKRIRAASQPPTVLNLFAYTGGASIHAAAAGASVTHVDAANSAISWAKKNAERNAITSIRWIVDDCSEFVARELRRGTRYNAIILDPPAFGHDHKGNIVEFEKSITRLLDLCSQILSPKPLFFIMNGYGMRHSAIVLKNLVEDYFPDHKLEYGELHLKEQKRDRTMPCNIFVRF